LLACSRILLRIRLTQVNLKLFQNYFYQVLGAFTPYAMMMNRNAENHYFDKRDAAYQPNDSWREWLL
jgi:hypothetical protein